MLLAVKRNLENVFQVFNLKTFLFIINTGTIRNASKNGRYEAISINPNL